MPVSAGSGNTVGFGDIVLKDVRAVVRRVPTATVVRSSFGTMRDRPAVFLRVTDAEGRHGYGEIWCNFPHVGAEHRQRLANDLVGPLLLALGVPEDGRVYDRLSGHLHRLALQSGEWGPLRQVAAGFDAAVADLAARRAGLPLFRFLNGGAPGRIKVYASGIGPEGPAHVAERALAAGHRAFKLKVGFGRDTDLAALRALRSAIGPASALMIDPNQAWTLTEALEHAREFAAFGLTWIEEPIAADRPLAEWQRVAAESPIALAAGENIGRHDDFAVFVDNAILRFVQPDVAKWGGVSGCLTVARTALDAGAIYCPHFLGGGIGLLTSAHLLAAAGGEGYLEVDTNPNELRETLVAGVLTVKDGGAALSEDPGIGIAPDYLFECV